MTTVASPAMAQTADKTRSTPTRKVVPQTRRVLNLPLLIGTLIAVAVLSPAVYFWHSFQLDRGSVAYITRAQQLAEEEKWNESSRYYFRYLQVRPDDDEARVRLAEVFDKSADTPQRKPRAAELFFRAVGLAPDRTDLHERLVELLLELRRFPVAVEEAKKLIDQNPDNIVGMRVLALASYGHTKSGLHGALETPDVVKLFHKAIKLDPKDAELAKVLAHIYRNELKVPSQDERDELANDVMRQLVTANPDSAEAYLTRYFYRQRYQLAGAQGDIEKAVALAPEDMDVLLAAGGNGFRNGRDATKEKEFEEAARQYDQAVAHFMAAVKLDPEDERGHLGLGQTYLAQGKAGLAIDTWHAGLKIVGHDNIDLNARLVSTLIALKRFDETEKLLDTLDSEIQRLAPKLAGPNRRAAINAVNFLRAKWLVGKGMNREAIQLLRGVTLVLRSLANTKRGVDEYVEASRLTGDTYAKLGQWDQAALAYEKAARVRPESKELRLLLGRAYANSNQLGKAGRHIDEAIARGEASLEEWFTQAEIRLKRQLSLPESQRNWEALESQLREVPNELRTSWQLKLLQADYVTARGGDDAQEDAMRLLKQAEQLHPNSADLFQKLVLIYERLDDSDEADRVMSKLGKMEGQSARVYLVRAEQLAQRQDFAAAEALLKEALEKLPEDQHAGLRYSIVQVNLRLGKIDEAYQQLLELHKTHSTQIGLVRELAEIAFELQDLTGVERWEKELRNLEGADSCHWRYYRARRLLAGSDAVDNSILLEVTDLQDFIQSQRPNWPAGQLLKGLISQRTGNNDEAIEAYEKAIELGESRVGVYELLIGLLRQKNRLVEAEKYLNRLQQHATASQRLTGQAISVALGQGDRKRAMEVAQEAVKQRPKDSMAWVQFGHTLLVNGENQKAETAFKKAVELTPSDVQAWNGLFSFYLRSRQTDQAKQTLASFPKGAKVTPSQKALILAQGHELLGDRDQAKTHYLEARRLEPKNTNIQIRYARFLNQTDPDEAEKIIRAILKTSPEDSTARSFLVSLLQKKGGKKAWEEARSLLRSAADQGDASSGDQRQLARALVQRGGIENRSRARKILQLLIKNPQHSIPADRLLLVRLLEADGRYQEARREFLPLVNKQNPNPAHMAQFVDMLMRNKDLTAAKSWLAKIVEIAPDNLGTWNLRVRYLKAAGQASEIKPLVDRFAVGKFKEIDQDSQKPQFCLAIGKLYTSVEMHNAAEFWYRGLVKFSPESYQPLVRSLASQGRMTEAIELCQEKAQSEDSPRAAITLAQALTMGEAQESDYEMADSLFRDAQEKYKDNVDLLFSLAYVRTVQQRIDEAIRLYLEIHRRKPRHVPTLNNLAAVLSEVPSRRKEALKYVDRAIDITGRQPALLDTKSMVILEDTPDEAVELLEEATSVPSPDPRYHFHLAVAYQRMGAIEKARKALDRARDNDLASYTLTSSEQRMLTELEKSL